jgi:hypothetical protein
VLDQEEQYSAHQQEKGELRQGVRRPGRPRPVDDDRRDEEEQPGSYRIAAVQTDPRGPEEVEDEEADEELDEREGHRVEKQPRRSKALVRRSRSGPSPAPGG